MIKKLIPFFKNTMGIKDLRTFLKKENVDCFYKIPLSKFYGKRIAIDSLNWIFCYLGSAVKFLINKKGDIMNFISQEELYDRLVVEFINFNIKLMNHGITPVWIWDGVSKDNKHVTQVERRNSRKLMIEKKENIRKILEDLNPLERPTELLKELQQLTINTTSLKREKLEDLKNFSLEIGIPTIIADDEAESLAASLAVERIVAAAWTADTDTYPIGCPIVVKGFENIKGDYHFNAVFTPKILKSLDMTPTEFRDFCIMLGTDFNDRIPGIGPANSYKLIKRYKNLEDIEKNCTKHNFYMLKYKEIRCQFCAFDTKYDGINDLFINKEVDYKELENKYENKYDLQNIFTCLRTTEKPSNIISN